MQTAPLPFVLEAQAMLRDGSHFKWSTVTLIAFCFYVYAVEIERRRWDIVLAGLAFWLTDWLNEIANALILHFTHYAPLWTVTGDTSFLILIGLSLEISFLFFVSGVVFVKQLPQDRALRVFGIPNRWLMIAGYSCLCVVVELALHATGYFHWAYWFWNVPCIPLIIIFGYGTFFTMAAWVFDMGKDHRRQLKVVGALAAAVAVSLVTFGPLLRWI